MMSSGEARPIEEMRRYAVGLMSLMVDCCERLEIAGSIRRGKEMVRDVELVAVPKFSGDENLLLTRLDTLLAGGYVRKRLNKNGHAISWGSRYRAMVAGGVVPVDVFIVLPDREWGPTMLLRTGPGDANQALVTARGIRNNNGDMGVLPKRLVWKDGALWMGERKLETPEERDVFRWLELPYMLPSERTVANYQLWSRRAQRGISLTTLGWHTRTALVDLRPEVRVQALPSPLVAGFVMQEAKPVAVRLL